MSEEEEKEDDEGEEEVKDEEKDEDNEEEEKNEEDEQNDENKSNPEEEEEKDDNKKKGKKNKKTKKSKLNKFLQSKLKPSSEIKLDLKSGENNNHFINKLNLSNHSLNTAAFGNSSRHQKTPRRKLPIELKSNLQIITDINNDMDLLSKKLNINKVLPISINKAFSSYNNNHYYFNNNYDKEDHEIKKLINKANELANTNYTTYTNYKNNLTAYNSNKTMNDYYDHNSNSHKNKYFHTINNYHDFSWDTNKDNFYQNRNYNTLPNLGNNYTLNNDKIYLDRKYNYNHNNIHTHHKMVDKCINTSIENSLYSNDSKGIDTDFHHSRNYHRRKFFNNENNFMRKKKKIKYYLTENGMNNNRSKKPLLYKQPESSNIKYNNIYRRNHTFDNDYILDRDNYKKKKREFYRFTTENDNRPINILLGNE